MADKAARPAEPNLTEHGVAGQMHGIESWLAGDVDDNPELRGLLAMPVYGRMRRESSQIRSILRAMKLPIMRARWSLDPAAADPEVVDTCAAEFNMPVRGKDPAPLPRTRDRFSWREHLRGALLGFDFGFSLFEQVYRYDDAGVLHVRKIAHRHPLTVSDIKVAKDGGLEEVRQNALGVADVKPIPVSCLLMYSHEREGSNWFGESLLRAAYGPWMVKDIVLRVWAQSVDRNGLGVPRYTGPENAGEDDLQRGLELAQSWRSGSAAGAAIPHGAGLDLVGVTGTIQDPEKLVRYCDEQIARAALAHFLNLGTQTGSWALGSTFEDFFTMSLQSEADWVADTATQHMVEDFVDLRFGYDVPAPRIVCEPIGSRRDVTAEAIKILTDSGVIRSDEDLERFVREIYGLPASRGIPAPPADSNEGNDR